MASTNGHRPKVTLFMMTLNEIEGMREILPRIRREWCDQILVVDGGSTDGTIEFAREQGCEVYVQKKRGARQIFIEGMPLVTGDVVLTFAPDGNCLPEIIPDVIEKMSQGYDMVIASRYADGVQSEDDSLLTSLANRGFTALINVLHRGHYSDAMVNYRAWKTSLYQALDLDKYESYAPERWLKTSISIEPLLSVRAAKRRLRVTEIPGPEPPRIGGVRKLQMFRWGSAYLLQILREVWHWR